MATTKPTLQTIRERLLVVLAGFVLAACGGGSGGGGSASASTPTAQFVPSAPAVTVNAAANSVVYNSGTTVSWNSSNTASCASTRGGGTATSGSFSTGSLTNTTTYTVTCASQSGSVSQSVTVSVNPPVVVGCATTGATGVINLSNVPSRLTGVAPLSVFFDAAGTTAVGKSNPFHDLEYRWSFGDIAGSPVSGTTWKYGARANSSSRNAAIGPLAAHVFEVPGTYTVNLSVTDGSNIVSNDCVRVVVQDPDVVFSNSNTVCFSVVGNFANCPSGATRVQTSNFALAVNTYKGTNKRLLFRRGESFDALSPSWITANGPGVIGAYGTTTDPKPIVKRAVGAGEVFLIASASTPSIGDWRIMDLDINGQNVQDQYNKAIDAVGEFHQLLVLRLNIRGTWRGVVADNGALAVGKPTLDQWAVVDSTLTGIPGCTYAGKADCDWRAMLSGTRHVIQGNIMDNQDTGGSHVIRSSYMSKGIIANNELARAGSSQHAIKLHAPNWTGGAGGNYVANMYSEMIDIYDNKIVGGINPWTISIGPQNNVTDERVRNVIVERNWFVAGSGTKVNIDISASNSSVRNNIFTQGLATIDHTDVWVTRRGIEPVADSLRIFGNSSYSQTGGVFLGFDIDDATNVQVHKNLAWAPGASNVAMVAGNSVANASLLNNSTNTQVKNTNPSWGVASPSMPSEFAISPTSYAFGLTGTVLNISDFFGINHSGNYLGAVSP